MTPLQKWCAGYPIELADKLATINCIEELDGFKAQWAKDGKTFTKEELKVLAGFNAELLRQAMR